MKFQKIWIPLLLVGMAVAPAVANCIPAKTFTNFNTIENPGAYYYINFGDTSITNADILGRFWESGNRSGANEGTYDDSAWLQESYYFPGTDQWYLNGNLGDGGVAGCPIISLTVMIEDQKNGQFVSMAIQEDAPRSVTYDYSKLGVDTPVVAIPRPRLTSTMRSGNNVQIDVAVDDASAGVYNGDTAGNADITAANIYVASIPNGSMPTDSFNRDIATGGWSLLGTTTNGGTATGLLVDCTDTSTDRAIGVGMEVNGVQPTTVGNRTIVECDPTLADPTGGNFKLIDRPTKPGKGKPIKRR